MRGFILYCSGILIFYRIDIQNIEFTEGITQICGRSIQVYTSRISRFVINYLGWGYFWVMLGERLGSAPEILPGASRERSRNVADVMLYRLYVWGAP